MMSDAVGLPPWQEKSWQQLCRYIEQKRIPQALLITGSKGRGKTSMAKRFAHALLCAGVNAGGLRCGICRGCQLTDANTHPDLYYVMPEEEKTSISVNQIRTIVSNSYLQPQYDTYRVVIINPADSMTISAANAFLKCLEEPTGRTIFILISERPSKLPSTIASRCQRLSITLPETQALSSWMAAEGIVKNQATLSNLFKAALIGSSQLKDEAVLNQRSRCFEDWVAIAKNIVYPAMIAEKWLKVPQVELVDWSISWVADLIKCRLGISQGLLTNLDFGQTLQGLATKVDLLRLYQLYALLLASRQAVGTTINFQLMTEEILVQWQELNGRN